MNLFLPVFVGGRGYMAYYPWEITTINDIYFDWHWNELKYNSI